MRRALATALLFAVCGGLAWTSGRHLERLAVDRDATEQLLYLPNGKYLRLASLGQAPLFADAIYLWAIQFYSSYEREDRFRYVEHIFGDVIAELDPHYLDPYWIGAMIMSVEAHDLEAGLSLLDTGIANNPDEWLLPYIAGWECYLADQPERALSYFSLAAEKPNAPPVIRRTEAGVLTQVGNPRAALALWRELLEDPDSDDLSRAVARRKIRELRTEVDLEVLREAVGRYRIDNGRYPISLEQLRAHGYINLVPTDADGRPYAYDSRTGAVEPPSARVLGES